MTMLTLNRIQEKQAQDNLEWTLELLQDLRARPLSQDPRNRQHFHENVGSFSLQLGLTAYALERDADEVYTYLCDAAEHLAQSLVLLAPPESETHRNPWKAEQILDLIACFGNAQSRAVIAALRPDQVRHPVRAEHDALMRYLDVLRGYLNSTPIDTIALAAVLQACESPSATKEERLFLRHNARGLSAVEANDTDSWNHALAQILTSHGREARHGDLTLLSDGFISFRALMLAKAGIERGLSCHAKSDYLPLFLLEMETDE
jgi:hypothetical protein